MITGTLDEVLAGYSPERSRELDEAEAFPSGLCAALDAVGLPRWFVPVEHGGALRHAEDLWQIIRTLARRDFTVALGHVKTYLGAVPVWVAGSADQARALADRVCGGAAVSLALTEREHGSDLLAGDVVADGGLLTGEKWLINNANRAELLCVLARTDPAGGARGFGMFLVDKTALAPETFRCLPAVATHGVRGADISGIAFAGAPGALVGGEGAGLEIMLKGFQITRTLCSAMSVGMAEHALAMATDFARSHRLYDRPLLDLPHAARTLTECYTDVLVAEAVGLVATRGMHSLAGEQSVVSAIVKYLVPTMIDRTLTDLGQVLGARAMLADGDFQKVERDHRIVGIFDGSTAVNLSSLITQFPVLVRGYRNALADGTGVAASCAPSAEPLDPCALSLYSRAGCSVVQALPALVVTLAGAAPQRITAHAVRLRGIADTLHESMAEYRPVARDVPEHAFTLARRYTLVYGAAACLHLWWHNRGSTDLVSDVDWLDAALTRLLDQLDPRPDYDDADGVVFDRLLPHLVAQRRLLGEAS